MPKITIAGVHPTFDGEFELDFSDMFTGDELHLIKQHAGVRVNEIEPAMAAGDYDLIIALAKIAADRSGRTIPLSSLMAAKVGAITFGQTEAEIEAEEAEAELPPPSAPTGRSEPTSSITTSGSSSKNGSDDHQVSVLPGTGVQV